MVEVGNDAEAKGVAGSDAAAKDAAVCDVPGTDAAGSDAPARDAARSDAPAHDAGGVVEDVDVEDDVVEGATFSDEDVSYGAGSGSGSGSGSDSGSEDGSEDGSYAGTETVSEHESESGSDKWSDGDIKKQEGKSVSVFNRKGAKKGAAKNAKKRRRKPKESRVRKPKKSGPTHSAPHQTTMGDFFTTNAETQPQADPKPLSLPSLERKAGKAGLRTVARKLPLVGKASVAAVTGRTSRGNTVGQEGYGGLELGGGQATTC